MTFGKQSFVLRKITAEFDDSINSKWLSIKYDWISFINIIQIQFTVNAF